ncbi:MAG: ABC transporter permease [Synechococcus sp.]
MLTRIRQELSEVVPLALLVGVSLGTGLTQLLVRPLGQSSDLSLGAVLIATLQIFGPVGVNLLWVSRAAPLRVGLEAQRRWHRLLEAQDTCPVAADPFPWRELIAAAATAVLLLPYFEGAILAAAVVATPRVDPLGQLSELLSQLHPGDLLQTVLRTALFALAAEALCLRKAAQLRQSLEQVPRLIADAIPECFLAVILLEALWTALIDPLHTSLR